MKKKSLVSKEIEDLSFREMIGISQDDLAAFCGVSKSTIGMIDANLRNVSIKNKGYLEFMAPFAEIGNWFPEEPVFTAPTEAEKRKMKLIILGVRVKISRLEGDLKRTTFSYRQAVLRKKFCGILLSRMADVGSTRYSIVQGWERSANEKIKEAGPFQQKLKMVDLDLLKLRLKALEEIKDLENPVEGEGSTSVSGV